MPLLAIDTSLEECAAAVSVDDRIVITSETIGRGHGERLFGIIDDVLRKADLRLADIDRFVVTVGPGSFTGIRIGIAAARGFALATGRPAVGVTTLAAHAVTARREAGRVAVLAALPAKGGQFFAQLFLADGSPASPPQATAPAQLAELAHNARAVLAGAGAMAVAEVWPSLLGPEIIHRRSAPDLLAVLEIGREAGALATPPRPLYLRPPDAIPASGFAVPRR